MSDDVRSAEQESSAGPPEHEGATAATAIGPELRGNEFMSERLSRLKISEDEGETRGTRGVRDGLESDDDDSVSGDFRLNRLSQYRSRQASQLERTGGLESDAPTREAARPAPLSNWIPIGPSALRDGQGGNLPTTSGRTPGIAVAPGGTRIYVGTANGGVWVSEDTGNSWRSLMDAFDLNPGTVASDSLACGAIALVPGSTAAQDRIYVGSGEGHGNIGAMFGVGPIISTDGGSNWVTEPVSPGSDPLAGSGFYALAVDPNDPERVVAATLRGIYRREPDGSGGFHWDQKSVVGASGVACSVVVANDGSTTFFAAFRDGSVYRSSDGDSWSEIGSGFPASARRIVLAVQPTNANVVYAFLQDGRLFRLDIDQGNWREISGVAAQDITSNQGWYDLAIAIDPDNVNRVYLGGSTKKSDANGNLPLFNFLPGEWSGSLFRCQINPSSLAGSLTYIGGSVHADIHVLVFAPGDANKLWVGCDGGVYYTTNSQGSGMIFTHKNTGLQTLSMNHLDHHPVEDAVLFCGTQDNGGQRFTGEEAWLYSAAGDCGYFVVNWADPYQVLNTYTNATLRRSSNGGQRGSYAFGSVPLQPDEKVLFYAPLAGTPYNPDSPNEADIVAFGSERLWLSTDFGRSWDSLPANKWPADKLVGPARAITFASAEVIFVGTYSGRAADSSGQGRNFTSTGVYRFEKSASGWSQTRLDTLGGANRLPFEGSITDIAVDYADPTLHSIYITLGGHGDYRHVWHFNGRQWSQRSGPQDGHPNSLLDVQHNSVVTDPLNPQDLLVGADIGVWRSDDGGHNWTSFSHGLPDAAVIDLKLHPRRLLRASTHGRGVYEREIDSDTAEGIQLYVRDTQLDQGRLTTVNGLNDPTAPGEKVWHWRGPDIKLDSPDVTGVYQFGRAESVDFVEFTDLLTDNARPVATHATETVVTRVHAQIHNRGVTPANNIQVMALLANASAGLPALPAGYETHVQTGTPINNADWQTIGIQTVHDVRVGFPGVASFSITADMLPPPAMLAGNNHHSVLILIHHAEDPYLSSETHTDLNSRTERKAAHKSFKVVQFTGSTTGANQSPAVVPFRIHNASRTEQLDSSIVIDLSQFSGKAFLYGPPLETNGELGNNLLNGRLGEQFDSLQAWAEEQRLLIAENEQSQNRYHEGWSAQRLQDIELALSAEKMVNLQSGGEAGIRHIKMAPDSHHTFFLLLQKPGGRIGGHQPIQIRQLDDAKPGENHENVIGGLDLRVELQPEVEPRQGVKLNLRAQSSAGGAVIQANVADTNGNELVPSDGLTIKLALKAIDGNLSSLGPMSFNQEQGTFTKEVQSAEIGGGTVIATASFVGVEAVSAEIRLT